MGVQDITVSLVEPHTDKYAIEGSGADDRRGAFPEQRPL
jgi:hypothetical protein